MIASHDNVSMALFCDFENVALGVRDANYEKFDIRLVLERLLLKGSIVIKKAYCDWDRYKAFKAPMHEANFELIEIPHVRQSGKNSADIRLVVDALDLCYTKSHVDIFVIISGDSDFSPLVSKLRENAKHVIGVGVKQSTSDLLIANCDEFIFYDDLVRENARSSSRRAGRDKESNGRRAADDDRRRKEDIEVRKSQAIDIAVETFEALVAERGDSGKMWASALKDAIKRRKPDFNESYYGFRAFGNLLEEAQSRGLLEVGRDEKSGTYVYRSVAGAPAEAPGTAREPAHAVQAAQAAQAGHSVQSVQAARSAHAAHSAHPTHPSMGTPAAASPAPEPAAQDRPKRSSRRRARASGEAATATVPAPTTAPAPAAVAEAPAPAPASIMDAPLPAPAPGTPAAAPALPMHEDAREQRGRVKRARPKRAREEQAHYEQIHDEQAHSEQAHSEQTHGGPAHNGPAHDDSAHNDPAHNDPAHAGPAHDEGASSGQASEPVSQPVSKPKAARKTPTRSRRPRKTAAPASET
jgi:uncharacterized protein (TIGR00288 family)